ncbi:MAG: AsmA-like C-terminal region-containing protein, partial [Gammaproteobacteria bacterium]|nr:AsmA-like C-terminal region-containing protein [Gammaproteobacteria bacterium]
GRGNVRLAVNGSGSDSNAIQRSLNGSGNVELQDGVFRGVDVAGVLRQLETMIRSRQPGSLQRGEQTAFESFSSTLAINSGVISTDDLLIQSPGFQVTGRGTLLDLSDQSIAFNLSTTVDEATVTRGGTTATAATGTAEQYDIGGYSLPIACSGSLSAPRCLPDAGEILRARLQREVQERVTDLLDRSLGVEREQATTPPADVDQQPAEETQPEPGLDTIRDELINRALDRIFN